ncbi:MAG: GNAT family N-acetyltransferase [Firmicutes bacterium]|nr:GNAT family N-acetyltransferase [Bacillota bacterium]
MYIRSSNPSDLDEIEKIYADAREKMKREGNPCQWGSTHPPKEMILEDFKQGTGYVAVENGEICGVFAFIIGEDPTYVNIEGEWLNNEEYGTIHRIAGSRKASGVLKAALDHCSRLCPNIKIDTHEDNKIMQHLLEKLGFSRCGIIYVMDGTPRIAYQKKYSV